jgi:hypothetical protein
VNHDDGTGAVALLLDGGRPIHRFDSLAPYSAGEQTIRLKFHEADLGGEPA